MDTARSRYTWALVATGIAVLVGSFATMFSVFVQGKITDPAEILRIAGAELAAGRPEIVEGLVNTVELDVDKQPDLFWTREYLLGAAQIQQALEQPIATERRLALVAALPILQKAAAAGALDDSRGRLGHRLIGRAAFQLEQFSLADTELTRALELDPTAATQILPELIQARLMDPKIAAARVVEATERLLKIPTNGDQQEIDSHLLAAKTWIKAENWAEAQRHLDIVRKLAPESDQASLHEVILKLAQIDSITRSNPSARATPAVTHLLDEALEMATEVARVGSPESINQANLLGGRILRQLGNIPAALAVLTTVRMSRDPPYVAAGGIEEIELLAQTKNLQDLLTAGKVIVQEIGSPLLYDGSQVRLEDFRDRLKTVSNELIRQQAFQTAIDFSELLPPLVPEADALTLAGAAWKTWAEESGNKLNSIDLTEDARFRYQQAGRAWERAAKLRFVEDDYPDRLWPAIETLQQGGAFAESLELLDDYLRYASREGQPRGLLYKGKALMVVGRIEESLPMLTACVELYPRDPIRHEARLLAALANAERGHIAPARVLLEANVDDDQLEPNNPISRDSLIALGKLLYRESSETHWALTPPSFEPQIPPSEQRRGLQKLLQDAIDRLETADERYSGSYRPARHSRYLAAMAHRMAAHWFQLESTLPELIDSTRRELTAKHREHLETALRTTASLRKELSQMQESEPLTDAEELVLRNCYLTEGDVLFELNRFEDAINAYAGTALRYNGEPISLEATIRQARSYLAMNRPEDATRTYRQAEKNLERIPESQDELFAKTTRHDRAGWKAMLQWLTAS